MSPSKRRKLSELAGNLSPSREKASNAVQRVASAASDIWRHRPGVPPPPAQCSSENDHPFPREPLSDYDEIGRRITDPEDDKTMPPVVSNATFFLRPGPDEPNADYYVRTYQPRVGFDTSENKNVTDFSFTMSSKHINYESTARSRTFLCGTDENDYSEFALEWLLEELVNENDEIVCLRVVNPDTKTDVDASVLQEMYKEEARRLLDHFQKKNEDGIAISLVVELAVGKVEETIQAMIKIYSPASLIVGTKGKSLGGIQGLRNKNSISKYCLQNSPVPVVVVRPKDKRMKKKARRSQDPKRQNYKSILEQSNASGFDAFAQAQQSDKSSGTETEANAVAKAIGLNDGDTAPGDRKDRPSSAEGTQSSMPPTYRTTSQRSDTAYETESPSPTGPLLVVDDEGEEVPEMQLPGSIEEATEGKEGQVMATTRGKKEEDQQVVAEAGGETVEQQKEDEQAHESEGQKYGNEKPGGQKSEKDHESVTVRIPKSETAMSG